MVFCPPTLQTISLGSLESLIVGSLAYLALSINTSDDEPRITDSSVPHLLKMEWSIKTSDHKPQITTCVS